MSTIAPNPLENWPSRGYDGPQPWEHDELGISRSARDELVRPENAGKANTIAPKVSHTYPILTSGSADPCVHELGRMLGDLDYPNTVSEGKNPFGHVDPSIMLAVDGFRRAYGIRADPSGFGGDQQKANAHIDPWTVEAIIRAHHKLAA